MRRLSTPGVGVLADDRRRIAEKRRGCLPALSPGTKPPPIRPFDDSKSINSSTVDRRRRRTGTTNIDINTYYTVTGGGGDSCASRRCGRARRTAAAVSTMSHPITCLYTHYRTRTRSRKRTRTRCPNRPYETVAVALL